MKDLLDPVDGENKAVRAFLQAYSGSSTGITAAAMAKHLEWSGFPDAIPHWVTRSPSYLTKAGAQLWLRILFGLENGEAVRQGPAPNEDDPAVLWAEIHRLRAENAGPDGMSWKEAATKERQTRVTASKRLARILTYVRELNKMMGAESDGEGLCTKIVNAFTQELKAEELPETQGTQWCKWFPTTVMGHPMRQVEPGKWEHAEWPSDANKDNGSWWKVQMLAAAAQTGDPGVIKLAAQLAGVPPCEVCGFVKSNCRCNPE